MGIGGWKGPLDIIVHFRLFSNLLRLTRKTSGRMGIKKGGREWLRSGERNRQKKKLRIRNKERVY